MSDRQVVCPAGIDNTFGPWAGPGCRGGFDFTLLFEESILTIPLQCLLLLLLPLRVWQLYKTDAKVRPGILRSLKAAATLVLLALNIALLILWADTSNNEIFHTKATVPTAALVLASSVAVCILSWTEHERSITPSFILSVYLIFSTLLGLARARTLYYLGPYLPIPALQTVVTIWQLVVLAFETIEKRHLLLPAYQDRAPEEIRSTISGSLFLWLLPLFGRGYRKIIDLQDLYVLSSDLKPEVLHQKLSSAWEKAPDKSAPGALMNAWFSAFARPVLAAVIPRLFMAAFTYTQPFLIDATIALAYDPEVQPYNNYGYGLIGAFALVYFGVAISTGQYSWKVARTVSIVRGSIASLVYKESLGLDITSADVTPQAAMTLITTDVETIVQGIYHIHEVWASLVEIAVADYLVYRQLGSACAIPIVIAVLIMFGSGGIAIPTGSALAAWIKASETRVTATSKILQKMKWLNISGLTTVAFEMLANLRVVELGVSLRYRKFLSACLVLLIFAPVWTPILTFCVYGGLAQGNVGAFSVNTIFTAYSVLQLLTTPVATIIVAFPSVAGAIASFQRVQDHLNGKKREDNRNKDHAATLITDVESGEIEEKKGHSPAVSLESATSCDKEIELSAIQTKKPSSLPPLDEHTIASVQGKFSWTGETEPVLDINRWDVERHALNLVTGPVGCGKSTLVKSLLGELTEFQGTVRTTCSGVAYCSQTPWIPNRTIREIITDGAEPDESYYRSVLKACALEKDIRRWANGENTSTGSNGISLSGGQKQRLSLARALYSRKELLVLDDVFSGLDADTEKAVFTAIFGKNGLVRSGRITTVLATSHDQHLAYADQITALDSNGRLRCSGPIDEVAPILGFSEIKAEWDALALEPAEVVESADENAPNTAPLEVVKPDDPTRRLGDSGMYKFYAQSAGAVPLLIFAACMAIYAFGGAFPSVWLGWWASAAENNPNEGVGKWLGVYVVLGVIAMGGATFGAWELFVVIIGRSGLYFHSALLDVVSSAPLSFHATVDTGITINRFSQDIQLIDMELPAAVFGTITTISVFVAQFIIAAVESKYAAVLLPVLAVVFWVLQHFYLRTSRQLRLLEIEYKAGLYTQLTETISGLMTVRAFEFEDRFEQRNMALLDDALRPSYLLTSVQTWLNFTLDMIIAFVAIVFIALTTSIRTQIGGSSVGTLLSSLLGFTGSAQSCITFWVTLEVALGAVARVGKFVKETDREETSVDLDKRSDLDSWPRKGGIELRNMTAAYLSATPCLSDISLKISPGEKVAICGRTGSGKSTLVLCLLRALELQRGSILIDDVDIASLPHRFLCSRIAALPQEVSIFDGSLRMNVDPAGECSDEEILSVLEKVHLSAKVSARGGLDTLINDGFFSPGEAQLLVFARVMLRRSKILILDEFTSSLDDETSLIVEQVLRTYFEGWTIIAIVHKLASVRDYDKVAVLDAGNLIEFDSPAELLAKPTSLFKTLYEISTGLPADEDAGLQGKGKAA